MPGRRVNYIATPPVPWKLPLDVPNSRCPVCGQPVWFFRNKRGGCAYFDAVGKPWPLHPCMEAWATSEDARAVREAIVSYGRIVGTGAGQSHSRVGEVPTPFGHPVGVRQPQMRLAPSLEFPNQWIALSGLLASLESLPVGFLALAASDGGSVLLLLWMIVLPVIAVPVSLGMFLDHVPRRRFDGEAWIAAIALSPLLMFAGIATNFFTLGFGLPTLAVLLSRRALTERDLRRRGLQVINPAK